MKFNKLGNTGMEISELSFGASSLGGVFHSIKESEANEAVFTAVDGGINFIDVSPYYGHYKAETVLGKALKDIPRDKFYLSTKVGRYGKDGVNIWDYSAKRAVESVLSLVCNETLPALCELREKGIVGHVGITDLQPENLKWVIEHVAPGTVESVLCFCHYCLNDDLLTEYFDFFESRGIGIINASPLSMGLLSSRGVPDWHPAPKALVEACSRAAKFCEQKGYPIETLAVQYSLSSPHIASTLFSSANPANVRKNIEIAGKQADPELVREVKSIIGDQLRVRWKNS